MKRPDCPCKRMKCERYGDCDACGAYHHSHARKPLTRCEKLEQKAQRRAAKGEKSGRRVCDADAGEPGE